MLKFEEEKQMCRDWFDKNLRLTDGIDTLPYNFKVGSKSLNNNLDKWDISVGEESQTFVFGCIQKMNAVFQTAEALC